MTKGHPPFALPGKAGILFPVYGPAFFSSDVERTIVLLAIHLQVARVMNVMD
jgi:hypothetical protein